MSKPRLTVNEAIRQRERITRSVEVGEFTVVIRSLTRGEVMAMQGAKGLAGMEARLLSMALLDPKLTEAEAAAWIENSPAGEIEPVTNAISEISGLGANAGKQAMSQFLGAS